MPSKQPDGTFSEVIDDVEYNFQVWGAERAVNVGIQIGSLCSKGVTAAAEALMSTPDTAAKDVQAAVMGNLVGAVFSAMGERRADAMDVIKTLATQGVKYITPEGKQRDVGSFDNVFRGRLSHLQKVVKASAEVQYGDFFADVGGSLMGR